MKRGFIRKYNNCNIINLGDVFIATNEHGLNIGQSRTIFEIEYIIDNYINNK